METGKRTGPRTDPMKLQIHEKVESDLVEGYRFYESQESGLGDYFLDSLFSDIDSLQLYAGIIVNCRWYTDHRSPITDN